MPTPNTVGDNEGSDFGPVNVRSSEDSQAILQRILAERGATVDADAHHAVVRADINGLPETVDGMDTSTRASISALLSAAGHDDGAGLDEVAA